MTGSEIFNAIASLATAAAVVVGVWSVWIARRDANRRATLEQIREVETRLNPVLGIDVVRAREDVLALYRAERSDLSDQASHYMAFLNAVDMLAMARRSKLLDKTMVDRY